MNKQRNRNAPIQVAVFGAGITGLTAAHELVERGFQVEVFEKAPPSPIDSRANKVCGIGGMAATQWSREERPFGRSKRSMARTAAILSRDERAILKRRISYPIPDDAKGIRPLEEVAAVLNDHPEIGHIELQGFSSHPEDLPYLPETSAQRRQTFWLHDVANLLREFLKEDRNRELEISISSLSLAHRVDWTQGPKGGRYIEVTIIDDIFPGEHGFRFFPTFYRNLFDTMKRTPISDAHGAYSEPTRTVLDNLVRTKTQRFAFDQRRRTFDVPRRPAQSASEVFGVLLDTMRGFGCTTGDIARFQLKLFKYMTSCSDRRRAYESQSWWDFVDGPKYSETCQRYIKSAGQILVAARADECDARSYGNGSVQLILDHVRDSARTDGTLSGPTNLSWFDHWRRYLEYQGVEFTQAKLTELRVAGGAVYPVVTVFDEFKEGRPKRPPKRALVRDYCVIALDAPSVQNLVARMPASRDKGLEAIRQGILGLGKPRTRGGNRTGAFRDLSGIQYYFESDIRLVEGHTDYADSDWALSSISQPQFWAGRRGWWSGYRGVLSVDIGDWHTKSRETDMTAWESTRDGIAKEVWRQIKVTIEGRLPEPIFYHLDDYITFRSNEPDGPTPGSNLAPYLITQPGQFQARPGAEKYQVVANGLVFAGTYMQTYARMTTMEAANESARHAVNAILDDAQTQLRRRRWESCEIDNPEDHEIDDFKYLLDLDEILFEKGLPHFVDILDVDAIPAAWLRPEPDLGLLNPFAPLGARPARRRKHGRP